MNRPCKKPSPEEIRRKLKLAGELFAFAREIKVTQLRIQHPNWTDAELAREAYRLIEKGADAR